MQLQTSHYEDNMSRYRDCILLQDEKKVVHEPLETLNCELSKSWHSPLNNEILIFPSSMSGNEMASLKPNLSV